MRRTSIAAVVLAGTAMPAPALANGTYHVRNETQRPLTCGIRRPRSEVTIPVTLRPGGDWSQATARDETRTLICYNGHRRQTFRLQSGQRYALSEDGNGVLWLRAAGAR
ncbi:MAG TPA: hypothetical protein VMG08_04765 [Allosphingosinicella sp.]|nr:hypothetical protein [Allosphingosinicella sp.]